MEKTRAYNRFRDALKERVDIDISSFLFRVQVIATLKEKSQISVLKGFDDLDWSRPEATSERAGVIAGDAGGRSGFSVNVIIFPNIDGKHRVRKFHEQHRLASRLQRKH